VLLVSLQVPWYLNLDCDLAFRPSPETRQWLRELCNLQRADDDDDDEDPMNTVVPPASCFARCCARVHHVLTGPDPDADQFVPLVANPNSNRVAAQRRAQAAAERAANLAAAAQRREAAEPALPIVLCGSLSSIPISAPVVSLQYAWEDVWASYGRGWGGTSTVDVVSRLLRVLCSKCCAKPIPSYPLRLDYIFLDIPACRRPLSVWAAWCSWLRPDMGSFGHVDVWEVATTTEDVQGDGRQAADAVHQAVVLTLARLDGYPHVD
jgi:hypothetical protein